MVLESTENLPGILLLEFDIPVRNVDKTEKRFPLLIPYRSYVNVGERVPVRLFGPAYELHPCFFRGFPALTPVTIDAATDDILPGALTAD